jgi:hypothetical protein
MQTVQVLEKTIKELKQAVGKSREASENPRTDQGLRRLRKELRRKQRRRRSLLAVAARIKGQQEKKQKGTEHSTQVEKEPKREKAAS